MSKYIILFITFFPFFIFAEQEVKTKNIVNSGVWSTTVDDYGSITQPIIKEVDKIIAELILKPINEKTKKYTWGSVNVLFSDNAEATDLSIFSKMKIIYATDSTYEVIFLQANKEPSKEGVSHSTLLEGSNGKITTKVFRLKNFKISANNKNYLGISFKPIIPKGRKTKLVIKKIEFLK